MKVHHLDCGTMRPLGGRLINGDRPPWRTAELVAHCLLIETGAGLVLVDTGFGTDCVARPAAVLGRGFLLGCRPVLDVAQTALHQVRDLGFAADDVRHIVLTHLDLDHAGGLADFPRARVHLHRPEFDAATNPRGLQERQRYRPAQWAHGPDWRTYEAGDGDRWFGFEAVRELDGPAGDLVLIPLAGHSRGHTGVAVRTGDRWLLHAGDAFFHRGEVVAPPHCTPGLKLFQGLVQAESAARHANQTRLRELAAAHGDEVDIVCAHDPEMLARHQTPADRA